MKRSLLTATVLLMASSGLAFAQSAPAGTASDSTAAFSSWDQTTRDAFFSDDNALRSSDELRSGWESLDAEKQAQIRADCSSLQASAGGAVTGSDTSGGMAAAPEGTSSETTASTTMDSTSSSGGASMGSDSAAAGGEASVGADMPDQASLQQLCDEIQSF